MGSRGFAAVAAEKKRFDEDTSRMFTRYFRLEDGEARVVRFFVPDDPYLCAEHGIKSGPNDFMSLVCAAEVDKPCVCCHAHTAGDKRVGRPSQKPTFNVADSTWVHKSKNEDKTAEAGKDRFDFVQCTDDETCKVCYKRSKNNPRERIKTKAYETRERTGGVTWSCSISVANQASGLNQQLQQVCVSCGFTSGKRAGKIQHVAWKCRDKECNSAIRYELADPGEEQSYPKCRECGLQHTEERPPREVIKCDKCKKPRRGSLFDADITVGRQGKNTNTVYTLQAASTFEPPESWVTELVPADLEKIKQPLSADAMAQKLGVPNPFKSKVGAKADAVSYDDDEDDDFAPDDDDDEPAPKRKGPPKKGPPRKGPPKKQSLAPKKRRPVDDEEE